MTVPAGAVETREQATKAIDTIRKLAEKGVEAFSRILGKRVVERELLGVLDRERHHVVREVAVAPEGLRLAGRGGDLERLGPAARRQPLDLGIAEHPQVLRVDERAQAAFDQLRRERIKRRLFFFRQDNDAPDPVELASDSRPDPGREFQSQEAMRLLRKSLGRLSPRQRVIFTLLTGYHPSSDRPLIPSCTTGCVVCTPTTPSDKV